MEQQAHAVHGVCKEFQSFEFESAYTLTLFNIIHHTNELLVMRIAKLVRVVHFLRNLCYFELPKMQRTLYTLNLICGYKLGDLS